MARQRTRHEALGPKVARLIRRRRTELNLSQEELGNRASLDRTYISGIERGKRNITLETLSRVIDSLSMTHAEFFRLLLKDQD